MTEQYSYRRLCQHMAIRLLKRNGPAKMVWLKVSLPSASLLHLFVPIVVPSAAPNVSKFRAGPGRACHHVSPTGSGGGRLAGRTAVLAGSVVVTIRPLEEGEVGALLCLESHVLEATEPKECGVWCGIASLLLLPGYLWQISSRNNGRCYRLPAWGCFCLLR